MADASDVLRRRLAQEKDSHTGIFGCSRRGGAAPHVQSEPRDQGPRDGPVSLDGGGSLQALRARRLCQRRRRLRASAATKAAVRARDVRAGPGREKPPSTRRGSVRPVQLKVSGGAASAEGNGRVHPHDAVVRDAVDNAEPARHPAPGRARGRRALRRRDAAGAVLSPRRNIPKTGRGGAAAATWRFRGDTRRRRDLRPRRRTVSFPYGVELASTCVRRPATRRRRSLL